MEKHFNLKNQVIPIILGVFVVVLTITVFAQNRRINFLEKKVNNTPAENTPSGLKAGNISSETSQQPEDVSIYEEKIKKLETKIAHMDIWQDYLEENLQNCEEETSSTPLNKPNESPIMRYSSNIRNNSAMKDMMKVSLSSRYNSFAEENFIPSEVQQKLVDLLFEKQNKLSEMRPIIEQLQSGKAITEDMLQEMMDINADYEEQISELLTEEEYVAFQEYQKVQQERMFIDQFKKNMLFGDTLLEKQQEKELIAAMYNDRQNYMEMQKARAQEFIPSGGNPYDYDKEYIEDRIKENFEAQKELYDAYVESAENILSESQMQKFETYIKMRKSSIEMLSSRASQFIVLTGKEETDERD